ncbi:site-specific integrase [Roseivirga misakiensis]|uniref:Tyr recombinase domain-containing protein n=1 Tax=Roseivirga misakiensis TaxID=1563681 RepID=A0A1E5T5R1_9BACT|nr:site-specific integrase [Roseivirga misakiensis]OEK06724.1 hypothetical protein BFP71_03415 [Roseivirga misakiensis]
MGVTFKPVHNRTNAKNKSGLYSIHIRVTVDRETRYFDPDLPKLPLKYWSGKENKWVKDSHHQHYMFNTALMDRLRELQEYQNNLMFMNRPVTFDKLKTFFERKGDKNSFNDYVVHYIKTARFVSLNTRKKFITFQKHLDNFNPKIRFNHLEESLILEFRDFLLSKGHSGSTVDKYFSPFKKIVRDALKHDYLMRDPFFEVKLEISLAPAKRTALNTEELTAWYNLKLPEDKQHLVKHRDVFSFQCRSGLYYNDVKQLSPDQVIETEAGLMIESNRFKNNNKFIIPIYKLPYGIAILKQYMDMGNNPIFPTIEEPAYNRALKEIAALAGIDKNITNKVGRHTFTDLMISKGFPRQFVSKMLGHKKEQTTQIYYEMNAYHMAGGLSSFEDIEF